MKLQGIDVSKHQGTITWSSLKGKIDFAIIRAGYGRYAKQKDAQMDNNVKGAKANGIPYGFYWYSYATTVAEAKQEAQVCLQVIKGTDPTWPVFFDQEYEPGILALSTQTRTDICKAFMDAIKAAGYKTGLYCSYDWLMNKVYRAQLDGYDKWVAQYANSCSYTGNDKVIWQYSSSGRLSGINTNVDMNYGYKDYNTDTDTKGTGKWQKYADGRWRWVYEDGSYDKNEWLKVDGRWYWLDTQGYCITGYKTINGKDYYFAEQYALNNEIKECQLLMTDTSGALK